MGVGIDSGWGALGWAIVRVTTSRAKIAVIDVGTARVSRERALALGYWGARVEMMETVRLRVQYMTFAERVRIAIECPEPRSAVAAARGSLIQIALVAGWMARSLHDCADNCDGVALVTPRQWKGSLSKRLTWSRCLNVVEGARSLSRTSEHARDAVGLALYAAGVTMRDPRVVGSRGRNRRRA